MTALLTNHTQLLKEKLVPLAKLSEVLELTLEELNSPLLLLEKNLKLKPIELDKELFLEPLQADLLLSLQQQLKDLDALQELLLALKDNGALIYRCSTCGELQLSEKVLTGADLKHSCNELASGNRRRQSTGCYELIASGSLLKQRQLGSNQSVDELLELYGCSLSSYRLFVTKIIRNLVFSGGRNNRRGLFSLVRDWFTKPLKTISRRGGSSSGNTMLRYKGYSALVRMDNTTNVFVGKVEGINDLITFEAKDYDGLEREFEKAVDSYLDFCSRIGKNPGKTYSGKISYRTDELTHQELANIAAVQGVSINTLIDEAVKQRLSEDEAVKRNRILTFSGSAM